MPPIISQSDTLDYIDRCNSAPLETYLRLLADIFLTDEEYVYFMLSICTTGHIEKKGQPRAFHVSDYVNGIVKQQIIRKVNKVSDNTMQGRGTDDPAVKAFCHMQEINFIERNTSSANSTYQANASYLFHLDNFLMRSFYRMHLYLEKLETELKNPLTMRHVKYYCNHCSAKYTEADLHKLYKSGYLKQRICLMCHKPHLVQVTKGNSDKDDMEMKRSMLVVLKELHSLGKMILTEYMDKKKNYYCNRLEGFQKTYEDNFQEGQVIYNKCNNAADYNILDGLDADNDHEDNAQDENFTLLTTGQSMNMYAAGTAGAKSTATFQGALGMTSLGNRRKKRVDVTFTDAKSLFPKRKSGFWRSEKLGGITILGESTRQPKWFADVNRKALRILDRSNKLE